MINEQFLLAVLFIVATFFAVWLMYFAASKNNGVLIFSFLWLVVQAILGYFGFYEKTDTVPPRFLWMIFPPVMFIFFLFFSPKGKVFQQQLSLKGLVLLHVIRIPIELVLYGLFILEYVPRSMTFEGHNFDILSGITAPIIYYFVFVKKKASLRVLFWWNLVCMVLLIQVVINAVLSAPSPFQRFAFDQPNVAVLFFPYNWLPSFVVPLMIYAHLTIFLKSGIKKEV